MCGSASDKYMSNFVCSNNKDMSQRLIVILVIYLIMHMVFVELQLIIGVLGCNRHCNSFFIGILLIGWIE